MRGKGQFETVIGVTWDATGKMLSPRNYRVWLNKKGREIQQPLWGLAAVHSRIAKLLSRIELPDYIYSKKGRSYVDNARRHLGLVPLVKTDIYKFYPSVTWDMVYRLFLCDFKCAADIARRFADICCYRQEHLPTGSKLSGRVAFFAARHMLNDIATMAAERECRMTAYVDDITVSGAGATKRFLGEIRSAIRKFGFRTKHRKSKTFGPSAAKRVTGTIVAGEKLRLPNVRHLKIRNTKRALAVAVGPERDHLKEVLRGRLQEARQILQNPC